jgi:hypothetical protein
MLMGPVDTGITANMDFEVERGCARRFDRYAQPNTFDPFPMCAH